VTDDELVRLALAGDAGAFDQLVIRHQAAVFRAALAALRVREEAEEAAQDALVRAWKHLGAFRGDSSFRTWLLSIAWHRERSRQVVAAIEALSPKLRDALLLAHSGEYSYDDVAAMLKIPVGTVKWRVSEARRQVKRRLAAIGIVHER
jgi:DNA-directed RNA polymerase specialized sigma24 family protein